MVMQLMLVMMGGAAGSGLRWGISHWMHGSVPQAGVFPWPTFIVNVAGCIAAGAVWGLANGSTPMLSDHQRLLLLTGFLGGFTTFSALGVEAVNLSRGGDAALAAIYVLASNVLGLAGAWAGMRAVS